MLLPVACINRSEMAMPHVGRGPRPTLDGRGGGSPRFLASAAAAATVAATAAQSVSDREPGAKSAVCSR